MKCLRDGESELKLHRTSVSEFVGLTFRGLRLGWGIRDIFPAPGGARPDGENGHCTRTVVAAARHSMAKVTANMQHVGMTQFAIMGVLLANWKMSITDFIYTGR